MFLNKSRSTLLLCSTLISGLLVGCSTTDAPNQNNLETSMNGEMLRNGQFVNGNDDWWVAGGKLAVKGTEGCINVTKPGSKPWDVILGQGGSGLIKGASYTLAFTARANIDTSFKAIIQHEGAPYTKYFSKDVSVTSKATPFSFTFTQQEKSDPKTDFQLQLGAQKQAMICVSNLSLTKG
ncbi:hypothetical protein GCM10007916_17890 [Psychromonas marina]|uniref:CBM-cenC domain-containing protein n=1 Tax=Psychromonas marina TaxID=88364 RepID=A0ABQ6E079_9GAMM|nr:carbohydrate binding domain-containing protein [Psychromonas marina]GLS90722.1 hypothetical protein GCM10007916_17890 [Psychromonas marina]